MSRMRNVQDFFEWKDLLKEERLNALKGVECPARFRGRDVPQDLNGLTLEQLARLWRIRTEEDLFREGCVVVLGEAEDGWENTPLLSALGAANMISEELPKVMRKWDEAHGEPSAEEAMAGSLDLGIFGIADWYARRMGIGNHDEVFSTPWVRIWQCMYNDRLSAEYQDRLADARKRLNQ